MPHSCSSAVQEERERRGRQFSLSAGSFLWQETKAEGKHCYQRFLVQQTPPSFSSASQSLLHGKRLPQVLASQKWASCALPTTSTPPSLYSGGSRIYLGFILYVGVLAFHVKSFTMGNFSLARSGLSITQKLLVPNGFIAQLHSRALPISEAEKNPIISYARLNQFRNFFRL